MFVFQKLQNQKPKREATSLNEAKIQALSKNNNVEDTPQDSVIIQGKHLYFRGKINQTYIIFQIWQLLTQILEAILLQKTHKE